MKLTDCIPGAALPFGLVPQRMFATKKISVRLSALIRVFSQRGDGDKDSASLLHEAQELVERGNFVGDRIG